MNDDFEKRLQRVAPREIPSAWRAEVLKTAQMATAPVRETKSTSHKFSDLLAAWLTRQQRVAWTGLAGTWLVILMMNLASPEHSNMTARTNSSPTPETLQVLKQQKQLLAELVDRPARPEADRIRVVPMGPRSQRRDETATA